MSSQMPLADQRMFELLTRLKAKGVIRFDTDFCRAVGIMKQNLARVKQGKAHFTPEHIRNACIEFNEDANWILGTKPRSA